MNTLALYALENEYSVISRIEIPEVTVQTFEQL